MSEPPNQNLRLSAVPVGEAVQGQEREGSLFVNVRGELVSDKLTLTVHPEQGPTWQRWGDLVVPRDIFQDFRLIDAEESEKWANVLEHSMFVTASAITVGRQLIDAGLSPESVDLRTTLRAAVVHDAAKRLDVEQKNARTRDLEPYDQVLAGVLERHGFSYPEITAASNTGRPADRFISEPDRRKFHIAAKTIAATLVGYCDARTRETRCLDLAEARDESLALKSDTSSVDFFTNYWYPYYRAVEDHLAEITEGRWSPDQLTQEAIFNTVKEIVDMDNRYGEVFAGMASLATRSFRSS